MAGNTFATYFTITEYMRFCIVWHCKNEQEDCPLKTDVVPAKYMRKSLAHFQGCKALQNTISFSYATEVSPGGRANVFLTGSFASKANNRKSASTTLYIYWFPQDFHVFTGSSLCYI